MTDTEDIIHTVDQGISRITLNRPEAGNALTPANRDALIDFLGEADGDSNIRSVVIGANGKHFCTGADLRQDPADAADAPTLDDSPHSPPTGTIMRVLATGSQRLITSVLDCSKPVVAAVNGTAAGIGAHLALACDLVVAAEGARFIEVFVRRGIIPDGAGAYLLPRIVGMQRAKELMLLGDALTAGEALTYGMVNRVVPHDEVDRSAGELARRLAQGPTIALGLTKRLVNRSLDQDRASALLEESMAQELITHTEDATEGIASFVDRRSAHFSGR
jgi:2-(1,2-epoxy-1,2-dihydrophenyl)acetyl-CoA isomerase